MNLYKEDMKRYTGQHLTLRHKFFHYALRKRQKHDKGFLRKVWAFIYIHSQFGTGCEIATRNIGRRIKFPHMSGIIVSYNATIGDDCTILQGVTIGREVFKNKDKAPIIGNNVFIGAGAKVFGPIHIGDNVRIGANTVVTKDVPANCTVVGVNRIIYRGETEQ